jgi:hypothetical protein
VFWLDLPREELYARPRSRWAAGNRPHRQGRRAVVRRLQERAVGGLSPDGQGGSRSHGPGPHTGRSHGVKRGGSGCLLCPRTSPCSCVAACESYDAAGATSAAAPAVSVSCRARGRKGEQVTGLPGIQPWLGAAHVGQGVFGPRRTATGSQASRPALPGHLSERYRCSRGCLLRRSQSGLKKCQKRKAARLGFLLACRDPLR